MAYTRSRSRNMALTQTGGQNQSQRLHCDYAARTGIATKRPAKALLASRTRREMIGSR